MDRICISAIKKNEVVFYRADLEPKILKKFLSSDEEYIECEQTKKGNIFFNGTIFLQEWDKYKVKSLINSFTPDDFLKIGEYGSDDFGSLVFKNCIGYAKFKDIDLVIESPKISPSEMDELIDKVNSYIVNLSYDFNQKTFSSITRERNKKTDLDYHVYLMLHNALKSKNKSVNIFKNFHLIETNPCRKITSKVIYEDIESVREISNDSIFDIFAGGSELIPCNSAKNKLSKIFTDGKQNFVPREIYYEEIVDTFDNEENRFIKFFLKQCLSVIVNFQKKFKQQKGFMNYELMELNEQHIKNIKTILNQSFLKNVGIMQSIPMYSTVLTRRDGYRQLFHLYLGMRSMPNYEGDFENIREIIENKPLDVLYENYCYFALSDVVSQIYSERLDKKKYKVIKTSVSKTLEKKTNSNYFEFGRTDSLPKIRIHYNKNYVHESYSKAFDPDITIEIFNLSDEMNAIYVFDAKFRINIKSIKEENDDRVVDITESKRYKYDDISTMHTYRDAIRKAQGAFVLYPGTINEIFYSNTDDSKCLLCGVGAFKIRPGNVNDLEEIKIIISKLLKKYKELGC